MTDTRTRLLDAAERLFAEKGLHGVSTREIVAAAQQRNESAIQYHFGGRAGLLDALQARRVGAVETARAERLDVLAASDAPLDVRALLSCIVEPVVEQCRIDPGFRDFLRAFGQAALTPDIALSGNRFELASLGRMRALLDQVVDVPAPILAMRAEALTRFVLLSLCQWARSDAPFEGADFDRFFTNLMDMGAAMLTADASAAALAAQGVGEVRRSKRGS